MQAVFRFRHAQVGDYYSTRLLSHFLLHCDCGLKVAALARLLGLSRPTASRQQGLSAKEAIRQAHHRMDGRPYGKLLPRYAGPIAQFLFQHPNASRLELIDFIERTFEIHVSRMALCKFLKRFGLDAATVAARFSNPAPAPVEQAAAAVAESSRPAPSSNPASVPVEPAEASVTTNAVPALPAVVTPSQAVPPPAPPFSLHGRSSRAPSS